MRTLAIVLVLAAAVVGVLFALGFFEPKEPAPTPPPVRPEEAGGAGLGARTPETEPPPEVFELREPVKGLMLVDFPQRFNLFLLQQWGANRRIQFEAWGPPREPDAEAGHVPDLTVLPGHRTQAPRPSDLADVQVLAVHDMDPSVLEPEFWREAAARIQKGELGLLVIPGVRTGKSILAHEVLGPLLPVEKAADPTETTEGATSRPFPFEVTKAGQTHPATRLVRWPSWSERIWAATRTADYPWGTKFCYPVESVVSDATVLLQADRPRGSPIPAVVVGPAENGRVLWVGTWELGDRSKDDKTTAYGHAPTVERWGVLVTNWVIWLAGRVPAE